MTYIPKNPCWLRRSAFQAMAAAALFCPLSCSADSINSSSNSSSAIAHDVPQVGAPVSWYGGFFSQTGDGYTTPLDAPEFSLLGQTSGSFLLTMNTMYAFDGTPAMSVLSANIDPAAGVLNMNDPTNHVLSFSLVGNTYHAGVPEPRSVYLTGAGLLLLSLVWLGGRARRSSAP